MHSTILTSMYDTGIANLICLDIVGEEISRQHRFQCLDETAASRGVFTSIGLVDGWSILEFMVSKFLEVIKIRNYASMSKRIVDLIADELDIGQLDGFHGASNFPSSLEATMHTECMLDDCQRVIEFIAGILVKWEGVIYKMGSGPN